MMLNNLIKKSKKVFVAPQSSILSAASLIMIMMLMSRVLGLIRQRVLLSFFSPSELALFFAAFRLPDLVFEVFALGALSSAFIPVFAKEYSKDEKKAWDTASRVVNIGLFIFVFFSIFFGISANYLYQYLAPGFNKEEALQIAYLARILFAAQGFFVVSYIMTGVLESLRRFLVPAFAPIFYNLGIIIGTIIFAPSLHLLGPVLGVVVGALIHFLVQFPFAYILGFRFSTKITPNKSVQKVGNLALPRMLELIVLQFAKTIELYFASLISTASYTFYTLANSLQLLPVGLIGVSLAKAALPTFSSQTEDKEKFRQTFLSTLYQLYFLIAPMATMLIVLRIPIVRILFGTDKFNWEATVQTGLVLSAFAVSVPFQGVSILVSRAFYALHDTKTPVVVSILGTVVFVILGILGVRVLDLPTWSLALAFSLSMVFQASVQFVLISKKLNGGTMFAIIPLIKSSFAAIISGIFMFIFLKFFDRSVWVKQLSFITNIQTLRTLNFESFVLDTRYTLNLIILTCVTAFLGIIIYLAMSVILKSQEVFILFNLIKTRSFKLPSKKETETITPTSSDTTQV